jgi:hypothetical protein
VIDRTVYPVCSPLTFLVCVLGNRNHSGTWYILEVNHCFLIDISFPLDHFDCLCTNVSVRPEISDLANHILFQSRAYLKRIHTRKHIACSIQRPRAEYMIFFFAWYSCYPSTNDWQSVPEIDQG